MNVKTADQQLPATQPMEQGGRGLIPEDLAHFRWLEEVALSPDGGRVAYTVRAPRPALDGYTSRVYVQDVEAGTLISVSETDGLASSLVWSRQGALLAYVWQADGQIAVRLWAPFAGEVARIRLDDVPWGLDWHPDGRRIACVRWVHQFEPDAETSAPDTVRPTVRVIRRLRYKRDGVGFVHDRFQQVGVLDLNTGEWTQLSSGERDHDEPRWSHRGDRLVMVASAREQDTELGQGQLYVWEADSEEVRPLLPGWVGSCRSPQWGPDDRWIAFAGHTHPAPTNRRAFPHAWVLDLRTGETRDLMRSLDQMVGNFAAAQDQRVGYSSPTVQWPAGNDIYFLVTEQGAAHLYRASLDHDQLERLVDGHCVIFAYSSGERGRLAFGRADSSNPGDLHLLEDGGEVSRLTDLNPWLRSRKLSTPHEYWYTDTRSDRVHSWVIPPVGIEPGRRYPTVLYVHCSMFNWDFNHEFQCLANAGFVVAYFNQWGTTAGYGQAWTLGGQGDLGGREYEDIMAGVDDLVLRPFIDENRLGVTGWSCGGFLTNWIVGHTDRFKAAVSQVAIASYVNQWAGSDGGPEGTYRETGALPWDDLQTVWRQSPLAHVRQIRTPMLIMHAEDDYRVTVDQAEQLFAALRWLGREVELVRFAGESHLFHQRGRPVNRIERIQRILSWFQKYL